MKRHQIEQIVFLLILLAVFAWMFFGAAEFSSQAQTYPRLMSGAAILIAIVELIWYGFGLKNDTDEVSIANTLTGRFKGILPYLIWLLAYFAVIYVLGMVAASGLFVTLFLIFEGKVKWYYALVAGLIIIAFLISMEDVMSLRWPRSIVDPIEILGLH